jgi:histidine phosphotransfer protein HptB
MAHAVGPVHSRWADTVARARFSRISPRIRYRRRTVSNALVDRTTLDELGAVIGTEKLAGILDRFVQSLAVAFDEADRAHADYGREAHTLVSMSGMLGCTSFSMACRGFEQSAQVGDDLARALVELRALRDRTLAALRAVRAEAGIDR